MNAMTSLHKQFNWPLPSSSALSTPNEFTAKPIQVAMDPSVDKREIVGPKKELEEVSLSSSPMKSLKRTSRPPDLTIPRPEGHTQVDVVETTVEIAPPPNVAEMGGVDEVVTVHSSTCQQI